MNIRTTRNLLTFVAFPAGAFLFAYLGFTVHGVLVLLAFPWTYLIGFIQKNMRCPNCGLPLQRRKYRMLDVDFDAWTLFAPRRCESCGYDLTGREAGKS